MYISTKECAKELGMSYGQLRKLAIDGKVPYILVSNGDYEHRRFDVQEVKDALMSNRLKHFAKIAKVEYQRPVPCTKKDSTYLQRLKALQERVNRNAI